MWIIESEQGKGYAYEACLLCLNYLFNSKTLDTCLIEAKISTQGLVSWRFIPGIQSSSTVRMAYGDEKTRIINFMQSISPNVTIDGEGYITPHNAQG